MLRTPFFTVPATWGGVECEALAKHVPEVEREPAQKVLHRQQAQQAACAGLDLQEFAALHLT